MLDIALGLALSVMVPTEAPPQLIPPVTITAPPPKVSVGAPAPVRPACTGHLVELPVLRSSGCTINPPQVLVVRVPFSLGTIDNARAWCNGGPGTDGYGNGNVIETGLDAWCELDY